jgi:hypothetical protein
MEEEQSKCSILLVWDKGDYSCASSINFSNAEFGSL